MSWSDYTSNNVFTGIRFLTGDKANKAIERAKKMTERAIVPTWLCVSEHAASTYFNAAIARNAFNEGCKVFKSRTISGVLDYEKITRIEDIVDE